MDIERGSVLACALGLVLGGCVGVIDGPLPSSQPPPRNDAGLARDASGAPVSAGEDASAPPIDGLDGGVDEPDAGDDPAADAGPLDPADAGPPDAGPPDAGPPDPVGGGFDEVVAILNGGRCSPCHTANEAGGLRISADPVALHRELTADRRGGSDCTSGTFRVVAGQPDRSALYLRLTGTGCDVMPPAGALPRAQLDAVATWISEGATGP